MKNKWYEKFKKTHNIIWSEDDFVQFKKMVGTEINIFRKNIPDGGNVLDCGCGFGGTAIPLSHYGFAVVGIDNDEKVLACAIENGKNFGLNVRFMLVEIADIVEKFEADSFDACISGGTMEHFAEDDIIKLLKAQLIVAPNLIFSVPIGSEDITETDEDGIFRHIWTSQKWLRFLEDFNIVSHKVVKSHRKVGLGRGLFVVIKRENEN